MTNCSVLFFAQTDTESRLVMRATIRLPYFFFRSFCSFLFRSSFLCFHYYSRVFVCLLLPSCVHASHTTLVGAYALLSLSFIFIQLFHLTLHTRCSSVVCRQSIKYKTSLVGDEHIIRASKHVDYVCEFECSASEEHKQTTRDSYR